MSPHPHCQHIPTLTQTTMTDDTKLWVKSPYPEVPILEEMEIHEFLFRRIAKLGELPALTCGVTGKQLTYDQVYKQSQSFGAALVRAGYLKGDVAAMVLPNIPEFAVVLLGCWCAGLTIAGINPRYTEHETIRQFQVSEAQLVITTKENIYTVLKAKKSNPRVSTVILIGDCNDKIECEFLADLINTNATAEVTLSTGKGTDTKESIALLPFSSGTTGPPKLAITTHAHLVVHLMQYTQDDVIPTKDFQQTGIQERLVGIIPFFHVYGMMYVLLAGLYQGAHIITLPRFKPDTFLKVIRQHKPTCLHLVTPLIQHILQSPDYTAKELEPLHTIQAGGAPIGSVLINGLIEKAGRYIFFSEVYGLSEFLISHVMNPSTRNTKIGSAGRLAPSNWSKIVDIHTGVTLGRHKPGHLLLRGPIRPKGYLRNKEATRNLIDADGWMHTGDVAYYDEDGFVFIVDRMKELIKVDAFQVSPSELEDLLRNHPKVADCAVVGVSSEAHGQVPRAYIVVDGDNMLEEEIHAYLNPLVAKFKQLKGGIEFTDGIPKSPSGKILRRELTTRFSGGGK